MRLALIRQRYTPYGGAERFLEGALEALLERNVGITLYTREWPQTKLQLIEPHICNPYYLGRVWRDWGFARVVAREVAHSRANLVQSHERLLSCDVYRAGDGVHAVWLEERLADASALRTFAVRTNAWHQYTLHMERKLYASPLLRAVICNSKMVRDEIGSRFGLPSDRLPVVYNAVDTEAFAPALAGHRTALREQYRIPQDATAFLLVGSGYERKGVAAAIRALAQLPDDTRLLIVGHESKLAHYEAQARTHGVAARVIFAGPQVDPKPFFGAADAFVLPTLYDPCPNAALEALACALPVITSTKSGAAELVLLHHAGLVCPSRDVAGLVAHMQAMRDPQLRAAMGQRGRTAVEPLTPAAMTLQLVLLYKQLLESSVARGRGGPAVAGKRGAAPQAPTLHGEDGLAHETLPAPVLPIDPIRPEGPQ